MSHVVRIALYFIAIVSVVGSIVGLAFSLSQTRRDLNDAEKAIEAMEQQNKRAEKAQATVMETAKKAGEERHERDVEITKVETDWRCVAVPESVRGVCGRYAVRGGKDAAASTNDTVRDTKTAGNSDK